VGTYRWSFGARRVKRMGREIYYRRTAIGDALIIREPTED
jgi:hypothetical protein